MHTRCDAACHTVHTGTCPLQTPFNVQNLLAMGAYHITSLENSVASRQLFPRQFSFNHMFFPPHTLPLLATLHQVNIPSRTFTPLYLIHHCIPSLLCTALTEGLEVLLLSRFLSVCTAPTISVCIKVLIALSSSSSAIHFFFYQCVLQEDFHGCPGPLSTVTSSPFPLCQPCTPQKWTLW